MDELWGRYGRRADEEPEQEPEIAWPMENFERLSSQEQARGYQAEFEEEAVEYSKVPVAVKKSVEEHLPGASGYDAVRLQLGEVVLYNVVAHRGRTGLGITVSQNGDIVETEKDVPPSRVPKAVRAALNAYYPQVEFSSAGIVVMQFYEFEYEGEGGERRIVQIDAAGRILQDVDEADS